MVPSKKVNKINSYHGAKLPLSYMVYTLNQYAFTHNSSFVSCRYDSNSTFKKRFSIPCIRIDKFKYMTLYVATLFKGSYVMPDIYSYTGMQEKEK